LGFTTVQPNLPVSFLLGITISQNLIIDSFSIVDEKILFNRGYFRARLSLKNEDFLEIAESFTVIDNRLITLSYRYQWMDGNKQQLKKRWENVLHYPDLPNFPHHFHVGDKLIVKASESRNIFQILSLIEQEIQNG
jgi:uncharacterized membrane protein